MKLFSISSLFQEKKNLHHRIRWISSLQVVICIVILGLCFLSTSTSAQDLGTKIPTDASSKPNDPPHKHGHGHGSMPKDHHHAHLHGSMPKDHHHAHLHGSIPKDHHHAHLHGKAPSSTFSFHHHLHHSIPIPPSLLAYLENELMVFHTCAIVLATIPITFTFLFPTSLPWLLNTLLTAFASGTLLSDLFLHTLPSLLPNSFLYVFLGFLCFYVLQRVLFLLTGHTCHSHAPSSSKPGRPSQHDVSSASPSVYLQLLATFFHTFTNGFLLAVAFRQGVSQGVAAFLALSLHELPHRLSDYMLLQSGGASVTFAKRAQVAIAVSTYLGSLGAQHVPDQVFTYMVPMAQGGFMYIATTMILPVLLQAHVAGFKGLLCFLLESGAMAAGIWVMAQLA